MTWQDSLRQLDARLANGEIGASEYRKARDEILAEASSGSAPQPPEDLWTPAQANGAVETDPAAVNGETTIVVSMDRNEDDEQTQVVPAEAIAAQQAQHAGVPPQLGTPPPGLPPHPGPGLPGPFPPQQLRSAPIQGHEVFGEAAPKRGGMFVRILVPLLIVAVIGAGVWWFVLRDDDKPAPPESSPPSSSTQETPTTDELAEALPELPGKANDNNGTLSLERASELSLFTPAYATLLADHGADELAYRGAVQPGFAYMTVAAPIAREEGVDDLVAATSERLHGVGFVAAEGVASENPPVISRTDQAFRTYIAIYRSGDVWVQLNVSGPPDGDENALRTEFERVLGLLTERLPAD